MVIRLAKLSWPVCQTTRANKATKQFLSIADGKAIYEVVRSLSPGARNKLETALYAVAQEEDHKTGGEGL